MGFSIPTTPIFKIPISTYTYQIYYYQMFSSISISTHKYRKSKITLRWFFNIITALYIYTWLHWNFPRSTQSHSLICINIFQHKGQYITYNTLRVPIHETRLIYLKKKKKMKKENKAERKIRCTYILYANNHCQNVLLFVCVWLSFNCT